LYLPPLKRRIFLEAEQEILQQNVILRNKRIQQKKQKQSK
jgi:hypothetical protein